MIIRSMDYIRTIAMILKINSLICNLAVISVVILVIEGFRKNNETYFFIASFPHLIAFPTSIINLVFQMFLRLKVIKIEFFCQIRERFNIGSRINKLSLILSTVFLLHHINYGIWLFNIF